jgi:hypothetical protein
MKKTLVLRLLKEAAKLKKWLQAAWFPKFLLLLSVQMALQNAAKLAVNYINLDKPVDNVRVAGAQ